MAPGQGRRRLLRRGGEGKVAVHYQEGGVPRKPVIIEKDIVTRFRELEAKPVLTPGEHQEFEQLRQALNRVNRQEKP